MDPWLHWPGLEGEGVPSLSGPADLGYSLSEQFADERGWKPAAYKHPSEVQVSSQRAVEERCFLVLVY